MATRTTAAGPPFWVKKIATKYLHASGCPFSEPTTVCQHCPRMPRSVLQMPTTSGNLYSTTNCWIPYHSPTITQRIVALVTWFGPKSVSTAPRIAKSKCDPYAHEPRHPIMAPCSSSGKRSRYDCRGMAERSLVADRIAPAATETTHT